MEQQLKQTEEASTAQLQSAQQAAVTQAVQHSNQYQAELERAAGQRKQLQAQAQELQAALAAKESEVGAVQMQLAAALDSSKRVQENHGKVSFKLLLVLGDILCAGLHLSCLSHLRFRHCRERHLSRHLAAADGTRLHSTGHICMKLLQTGPQGLLLCMHVQSIAAKNALVEQMQQELEHVKATHTQANKIHEAHVAQLISSINELQDLCGQQVSTAQ